jgi:hypothetical protein
VARLNGMGWRATTSFSTGIKQAYSDFLGGNNQGV